MEKFKLCNPHEMKTILIFEMLEVPPCELLAGYEETLFAKI